MKKHILNLLVVPTYGLYRLWNASLRYTLRNVGVLEQMHAKRQSCVIALWHDEMFPVFAIKRKIPSQLLALISPSKDGRFLADILRRLGLQTVHGSSSRGGVKALLYAARMMRNNCLGACITVDGPRGPRHEVKDGVFFLAHRLNAPVIPVRSYMSRRKIFTKAWDRFQLPCPFSRVHTEFGAPYYLDPGPLTPERLIAERERLKQKLDEMTQDGAHSGWQGSDAGGLVRFSRLGRQPAGQGGVLLGLLKVIANLLGCLGVSGIRRLSGVVGRVIWHIVPKRRKLALANISKRLELPHDRAMELARKAFAHNVQSFSEAVLVKRFPFDQSNAHLRIESQELLHSMTHSPRPIVGVTAHFGAWELLASLLGDFGDKPAVVVARRSKKPTVNEFIKYLRGKKGATVLDHRNASLSVLRCLRKNGIAAFLVDHNTNRQEAMFLPFLGLNAAVNFGPAVLAIRGKALVMPIFLVREKNDTYLLRVFPALDTLELSGSFQDKIEAVVRFYTQAVETIVKEYPEQWFWMHDRWKTRPPDEDIC